MTIAIPYANLRALLPALVLVSVNVTSQLGPIVQLFAVAVILVILSGHIQIERSLAWVALFYFLACIFLGYLAYGPHQAVLKAGKLFLFVTASLLTVKGASTGNRLPALIALRAFLCLCAANALLALAMGDSIFRAYYLIEYSIYSAYTISILVFLARPLLTVPDRITAYVFLALCGSTMGLLLLLIAEVIGRKLRPRMILGLSALAPVGILALHFLMEFRGKSLTLEYLLESDRGNLFSTFFDTTATAFTFSNWIFGRGVGTPLHHFITPDRGFNDYLIRLGEGEVFSFCLHNEALRILCDFGLFGLLIVGLRLWKVCPIPVLALLVIGMLTNSYLYSFSGALIASGLFHPRNEEPLHA
ncbi:MAG: hypothetical protein AAF733_07290 [Verrucomicrobiota bacterium]